MKPMLAAATDGKDLIYPLLASPKLDGVRCIVFGGAALSRSLKPIPNRYVQKLFGRTEFEGFDGELIVGEPTGNGVFQRTSSGVMAREGQPDVCLHVFDVWKDTRRVATQLVFHQRLAEAKRRTRGFVNCEFVEHTELKDDFELAMYEAGCLADGYEGIMLRDPAGPYKHGRSTLREGSLLKLKRFVDSEAVIISCAPLLHNSNEATTNELGQTERSSHQSGKVPLELLGSITVRDLKTQVEFEIGTGFDQSTRRTLWQHRRTLPTRVVKYKSQPTGVKDKPRFPVFLGFRDPIDM